MERAWQGRAVHPPAPDVRSPDRPERRPPGRSGSYAAALTAGIWCVVASAGLAVAVLAVQVYRVLAGPAEPFGSGQDLVLYDRLVLLTFAVPVDGRLVLPLLALSLVAWLTGSPRARPVARRAAGGLAALLCLAGAAFAATAVYLFLTPFPDDGANSVLGPRESKLDTFGAPVARRPAHRAVAPARGRAPGSASCLRRPVRGGRGA